MGKGADGRKVASNLKAVTKLKRSRSFLGSVRDDLTVLKSIWFTAHKGDDHAARLENFYAPQADQYDQFRDAFLWGRKPMLNLVASRVQNQSGLVWIDMGGGTGENVVMMADIIDLSRFKKIYVVDLCSSLCKVAREKFKKLGMRNVEVVEGDACTFQAPLQASFITFSYSLSMIPPFHSAIDNAYANLAPNGFLGVADFYVSSKYDAPRRQMSWLRRFFWRSVFDTDGIDLGPERRAYIETRFERVKEVNSQGSIPYVPYLRAPWYCWLGRKPTSVEQHQLLPRHAPEEDATYRPPLVALFPDTFLYSLSWEDPRVDEPILQISSSDTVLTLTSGGCNALDLAAQGAKEVVCVDMNPAQTFLLELKCAAVRHLPYEDCWKVFGDGKHEGIDRLFEQKIAPFLSQDCADWWRQRSWYFKQGLYYQGGMGVIVRVLAIIVRCLGMTATVDRLVTAPTLEAQQEVWKGLAGVRLLTSLPSVVVGFLCWFWTLIFLNPVVMWFCAGVPRKQLDLIRRDGVPMHVYVARAIHGCAMKTHLARDNYFYLACLTGAFTKLCCPKFLKPDAFETLQQGAVDSVVPVTMSFMDALKSRRYSKVILMDHVDWLDCNQAKELSACLAEQVVPGGRVIWRTSSLCPPYVEYIEAAGFEVRNVQRHTEALDSFIDRVNMYASFWVAVRKHDHQA